MTECNKSEKKRVTAIARVLLTLEVSSGSSWGEECQLDQVHRQAVEGALGKLRRGLQQTDFRIIGEPTVTSVLTQEDRL